jgi:hypothetical protein
MVAEPGDHAIAGNRLVDVAVITQAPGPGRTRNRFGAGDSSAPPPPRLAQGARLPGASELVSSGQQFCMALPH